MLVEQLAEIEQQENEEGVEDKTFTSVILRTILLQYARDFLVI
jgi:hypothetical protein